MTGLEIDTRTQQTSTHTHIKTRDPIKESLHIENKYIYWIVRLFICCDEYLEEF